MKSSKESKTRADKLREASQQRRQQEKQDVRQAILDAASALFLEHGYQGFSLRQVAEQIGYSPGTLYLYFEDKDAILLAIMSEGVIQFGQMITQAAQPDVDERQRLYRLGQAYIEFGMKYRAHYQLMFMQRTDYLTRQNDAANQPLAQLFDVWRGVVEDAMRAGVLQMGDPVSTGDTIWALLHGVVSIALLMPNFDEQRIRDMADTALRMITRGVHK